MVPQKFCSIIRHHHTGDYSLCSGYFIGHKRRENLSIEYDQKWFKSLPGDDLHFFLVAEVFLGLEDYGISGRLGTELGTEKSWNQNEW